MAVNLTVARARIRRAKVGLIGYHAPGFINMRVAPAVIISRTCSAVWMPPIR